MSSVVYNVITKYRVDDAGARASASSLRSALSGLTSSLRSAFSLGALVGGGLAAGLGVASRGVVRLNDTLEQAEIGIGTLLAVNRVYGFNDALSAARGTLGELRADAAAGVGELGDYLGSYQQILSPLLQAGASLPQIRELNRLLVSAGFALRGQEGAALAGFDLSQAFTAGLGERTTPILNQVLRASGQTLEWFNEAAPIDKVTTLLGALKAFEPAVARQAASWSGLSSTAMDTVKGVLVTATQPLFGRWTSDLARVNAWLVAHKAQIDVIAGQVGNGLVRLWDRGIEAVKNWRAELSAAVPVLTTLAALQLVASGQAGNLARVGEALAQGAGSVAGGAAQLARGARWQVAAAGAGASDLMQRGVVAGGWKFSGLPGLAVGGVMELGGALKAVGAAARPLLSVLGKLAIPLAVVSAALSAFFSDTLGASTFLRAQLMGLWVEVKALFASIAGAADNGALRLLGAVILGALGVVVGALRWAVKALNAVVGPLAAMIRAIGSLFERLAGFVVDWARLGFDAAKANLMAGLGRDLAELRSGGAAAPLPELPAAPAVPAVPQATPRTVQVTHIEKVEVNQKVEQDGSPDRVAWSWTNMLTQIQKAGRQSRVAPVPVG